MLRGSRGKGLVKGSSDQTGSVTNSMLCLLMAAVTTRHSCIPLWNRQLMTIDEKFCRNPRARNVICATKRKWCSFKTMQFSMDFHGLPWKVFHGFPVIWRVVTPCYTMMDSHDSPNSAHQRGFCHTVTASRCVLTKHLDKLGISLAFNSDDQGF